MAQTEANLYSSSHHLTCSPVQRHAPACKASEAGQLITHPTCHAHHTSHHADAVAISEPLIQPGSHPTAVQAADMYRTNSPVSSIGRVQELGLAATSGEGHLPEQLANHEPPKPASEAGVGADRPNLAQPARTVEAIPTPEKSGNHFLTDTP